MHRGIIALAMAVVLPVLSASGLSALGAEGRPTAVRLPRLAQQIDGFTCELRLVAPESFGYLPLRLDATATGGRFTADRTIAIRVLPLENLNWPQPKTDYELELKLREGEASATATYYLPKYFYGSGLEIVLSEAGKQLDGYDLKLGAVPGSHQLVEETSRWPRFAVILPDPQISSGADWERVPDTRTIDTAHVPDVAFLNSAEPGRLDDKDALENLIGNSIQTRQILYESQTHRRWLGYESVDVILVAFGVLERMRETDPERFTAIRRWVTCGGALWTYGVGDAASLAEMFGAPAPSAGEAASPQEIRLASMSLNPANSIPTLESSFAEVRGRGWTDEERQFLAVDPGTWWGRLVVGGHPAAETVGASDIAERVFPQPVAAGIVVGIKDPDPFPGSLQLWHMVRHLTGSRQVWQLKQGRPVLGGTRAYWDWVLENVARPPVYAFLGVMSGFVLLVGPGAYYLTRRRGRTYLMFLIAPVLATVATLLLFGYGLVADGLGTQVRVRQITWSDGSGADGSVGNAARMTRSTYFAGLRPTEGLKFPLDAAVYPIVDDEEGELDFADAPLKLDRRITVNQEHQQFSGGFLPSRRQRQFIATRPIEDSGGIALTLAAGGAARVRNEFPIRVLRLIVRDADGEYHIATDELPVGGEVAVQPMTANTAASNLRELYLTAPLEPPLGYYPSSRNRRRYHLTFQSTLERYLMDQSWFRPGLEAGLFESRLRIMLQDEREIPRGWFVGQAELTEEAIVVDGARPVASVHFIMGTLR